MMKPIYISSMNCISPLGQDVKENWNSLVEGQSGITLQDIGALKNIPLSKITDIDLNEGFTFLENLLLSVAKPIVQQNVISSKSVLVLSTTKGNVNYLKQGEVEEAELFQLASKIAKSLGFERKPIVVSHACVSGLLAVSTAKRLIQMGECDEALVLAGDIVSEFVTSGFNAFQALSQNPCKPYDAERDGVTLGEAVAGVWVTDRKEDAIVEIIGEGAVNDANHISGPSRTGEGLVRSIEYALKEADIVAKDIDLISAHGTATIYNDEMEAIAFSRLGVENVPVNSLKGYYGHTLGASGLLELVILISSLEESTLIPSKGFSNLGTTQPLNIIQQVENKSMRIGLKTASGFGGSNCAMLIKKISEN